MKAFVFDTSPRVFDGFGGKYASGDDQHLRKATPYSRSHLTRPQDADRPQQPGCQHGIADGGHLARQRTLAAQDRRRVAGHGALLDLGAHA